MRNVCDNNQSYVYMDKLQLAGPNFQLQKWLQVCHVPVLQWNKTALAYCWKLNPNSFKVIHGKYQAPQCISIDKFWNIV
jgi:hypothetical protein